MERKDTYLRDGTPTGRVVDKHEKLLPGEYCRHAELMMKTRDDLYVMQQRSLRAKYFAGKWDITGGGVQHGETTAQAAVREAYEELGVAVKAEDAIYIDTEINDWGGNGLIIDIYAARVDVPEGGFKLNPMEVEAVRLVPYGEFVENVMYNKTEKFREILEKIEHTL